MISVQAILERLASLIQTLQDTPFSFGLLLKIVKEVVEAVESLSSEFGQLSAEKKKQLAEDTVEEVYRKLNVDIPKLPNWLEIWLVRAMTGILIDWLVETYNEKGVFDHATSTK